MISWLRKRRLNRLREELFDLRWSMPPATYSFDESQFVMHWREMRMEGLRMKISALESKEPGDGSV